MAVIKKTLFPKNLSNYSVLINDTDPNSRYFKISELPDTFTGGKNAFLIAGSEELVPDTKIQIELKDSAGNIIYHEPGEGMISSSINGESFVTEYYEGVSKVVAVYIYPDTAYGPCTLTILGELSQYVDTNGINQIIPSEWENKYNVKWEKQINVNPSLANTTKIRFYRRPEATITEILSPIYRIESGSKVNSGVSQSFADIKLSQLETFAGDVKRVKVFRTSLGDISDYDLIQDILVESKELLTSYGLSGSVVGQTGIFTSETLQNYWNTGSLQSELTSSRIESGVKLSGSGYFTYTQSLDIKNGNTYELNLDAFYSSSTSSNLGIYLSYVSQSINGPITFTSSIGTLYGTQPTKNLTDTVIPFQISQNYPSASLYFSQSQGEWHLGNISLALSQDTAFSPDEISFITTMPTIIGNETFNFKFEFYDVNNNYVPVAVTQSANFTGGNANQILRSLTFDSDRNAFRFFTGSIGNPVFQQIAFTVTRINLTGSVTYNRSVFDLTGSYIDPSVYASAPGGPYPYPGEPTNPGENGFIAHIDEFTGSLSNITVGSITYTASCDGLHQHETIYRFEDGDNAPGVFVTANTNQFIYKATDLSLNPTGQVITIEAKRKNLASADTPLTINSGSGKPPLTYVSTNTTNGVDTYTLSGTSYPYSTLETIYSISGSDQFGNVFSDAIKISPVKILDGLSVSLTNDNASLPALSTGFVPSGSFILSSGSVSVKVGSETIQHSNGLSISNSFDIVSAAATNVQTGSLNYSTTDYFITRLDADSGSLNLNIRYKDGMGDTTDTTKLVTYTKNKKAAPVLNFIIGNNNQSVTAKSTGAQENAFLTASFSVSETYDGASSTKALNITRINTTNSYATGSTTSTTLALPNMANGTDSVDISITGSVVDSENSTRNVFGNISLSKVKKAVPNVVVSATPQAQSVLANASGTQTGTLTNVTLSALEGTTSRFTSMTATYTGFSTNPTIATNSNILNTSAAVMNAAEASATIVVTHTDSEGTTGQTQTIVVRFTKVNTGTAGVNGADGGVGPGVVYRGDWAPNTTYFSSSIRVDVVRGSDSEYYLAKVGHTSTAAGTLDKPITGTSYTTYWRSFGATFDSVATNILLAQDATITRGLVMGTYGVSDKGFIRSANASALMTGKGYYLDTTGSMRFGDPSGAYIKFTESEGVTIAGGVSIAGTATIGGTSATTVKDGAAAGATAQQNGSAKTAGSVGGWSVDNDAIYSGTKDISGYSTTGITLNSGGSIHAPNFYIDTSGNAFFRGEVTATSGYIGTSASGFSINSSYFRNGTKSTFNGAGTGVYVGTDGIGLGTAFSVSAAGVLNATTATITGDITATNITATTAGNIAGWSVGPTTLGTTNLKLNSQRPAVEIYSGGSLVVDISSASGLSPINVGGATQANIPYSTTTQIQQEVSEETTLLSAYQVDLGADPLYSTGGTIGTFTPSSNGAYSATIVLGGTVSNAFAQLEPYGSPSAAFNYLYASYTIGVSIRAGGINGTEVANFSYSNDWSQVRSGTLINVSSTPNPTLTGTITVTSGTTYYMIPYISAGTMATQTTNGNLSTHSLRATYTTPTITSISVSRGISKSELVAGGFQVVFNTDRYIKVERLDNADFVSIGGGLTCTGDVTANTSDIRLKENIRIIENPLEKIENIRGVYFNYTDEAKTKTGYRNGEEQVGFIAQEVQKVLPHIVKPAPFDKDQSTGKSISGENYLTIQYEKIVPLLLEGIKQLKKEIEELKKNR